MRVALDEGSDTVLVTNDDLYFPQGSLQSLADLERSTGNIAAVGPITNYAFNFPNTRLFRIRDHSEEEISRIEDFASLLGKIMEGKKFDRNHLTALCTAYSADALKDVGLFDERYSYAMVEDNDMSRRDPLWSHREGFRRKGSHSCTCVS